MDLRRSLAAWLPFVAAVAIPGGLVGAIAWRARAASIVEAQKEEVARASNAAAAAQRELEGLVAKAQELVRTLPEHGDAAIAAPPKGADAVVLDRKGTLVVPAPPRADEATTPECAAASDALLGAGRAAARALILAQCTDLKSASGRYLWPLLATETADAARLPEWLEAHGDRLGTGEREILQRKLQALDPALRTRALAALAGPPSDYVTLRALLAVHGDETSDGVVHVRRGSSVAVLRTFDDGTTSGVVFHEGSILRAPPVLPGDLALLPGAGGGATVTVTPTLLLHVAPRDEAALGARLARGGNVLFGLALAAVLASIALAATLYARFLAARRLAELRTDFVAAVSHELRTPVASVQMLAELLESGEVADADRAEVEQTIARETRRLSETLNRMLRFGALSRGKLSADPRRVRLAPLAAAAAARLRRAHPGLEVEVDVEDALEADVDEGLIALALDNLLGNAAKYAKEGGPYRVEMSAADATLVIAVGDHGPGLDRRARARVFLPFERADDRLSRATEGTGVGLSLVRGIAQAHGGDARVESDPGQGARFILELPWKPS